MVTLTLSDAVSQAEAENINNYSIVEKDDPTKTLTVTKAVYDSAKNTVTLTTAFQDQVTYVVNLANITNLDTDSAKTKAEFAGADIVAPTLVSVNPLNTTYVDLQFSEKLAIEGQDQLKVYVMPTDDPSNVVTYANGDIIPTVSGNVLRLQFKVALTKGKNYTIQVVGVKDLQGKYQTNENVPTAVSKTTTFTSVEDIVAPQLTKVTVVNSATLLLDFNKELSSAGTIANYTIKDETGADVAFTIANLSITGDGNTEVMIKNTSDGKDALKALFQNGKQYTLTINGGVANLAGYAVATLTSTFTGVDDIISPKLVSASAIPVASAIDGVMTTKVTLTFDEQITADVSDPAKFVVTNTATFDQLTVKSAQLGDDKKSVDLFLSSPTALDQQYRVYISDKSIIKDVSVSQNQLDTSANTAIFNGVDTAAPTLSGLKLSGKTAAGAVTALTINVGALDAANVGTISITGLLDGASYNTGDFKLSEDVSLTFDAVQAKFDVIKDTPVSISKNTSGATVISMLTAIFGSTDGISAATMLENSGSQLYLKDAVGNKTDYILTTSK